MKLPALRQKLIDSLGDSLGTFANGQIAIWAGESEIPSGLASGVQCNIQPVPIANRNAHPVSGGMTFLDQSWRITLVNFDRAKTLAPIVRKVQQLSPRNTSYLPATGKTFEQYSFELFDPGFVGRSEIVQPTLVNEDAISLPTGIALSGHRAIATNALGALEYADNLNPAHANSVLGITVRAFQVGEMAEIIVEGKVEESSWNWIPGKSIFLSANGTLTQTVPQSGFLLAIGKALSPTKVLIEVQQPIIRS